MILYHGSNQLINRIDLSKSKDFKDFGRGFYLTKDYTCAVAMAQRTTAIMGDGSPEVSPFIFKRQTGSLLNSYILQVCPLYKVDSLLEKTGAGR